MFEDEEQQILNKQHKRSESHSFNNSNLSHFNYQKNNQRQTLHDNDSVENGSHFTIKNKENFLDLNFE
jgi:hypothetical protein